MRGYLIRRLLLIIPTLLLVTIMVFSLVRFIPGSIIDQMLSETEGGAASVTEATTETLRHLLGLDLPLHIQYGRWIGDVFRGDLGVSLWTKRSIVDTILTRLPVSFELGLLAMLFGLSMAIPIGVYSAMRQDTAGDYIGRTIAILAICLPSFWLGTMVIVYPSIWFNWMPEVEYIPITKNVAGNLKQFILPAFIQGMVLSGTTMRMTRTMMLEILRQDYIRTAWAKGLPERVVVMRHAMRNAIIPIITVIGLMAPILIGGTVVLEQIFSLPGVGRLLIDALTKRDYPMISGINLVLAAFVLVINLAVDLSYSYLDPKVRYQ